MLTIINDLEPFFLDNYQPIHVRSYARKTHISPPSASKKLKHFAREKLLNQSKEKGYLEFTANHDNSTFIKLSHIYWSEKLKPVITTLEKELISPTILIFGSFSKAEIKETSDIDLAVFTPSTKKITLEEHEKTLKRHIQLLRYKTLEEIKSKELRNNILNGFLLTGAWQ
ncbi:MAG TPA: nucleotidyltransferase domain-containing protein [Candidatus Nanoarchaeia archaeon]|nr:nucleotidyltransferase domain-containing protein [Candidatus Nanoarchaeia archaeon]